MDYIRAWKEVIQKPAEFYRKMPITGGYADPLIFATINFAISGILTAFFNPGISSIFGIQSRGLSSWMLTGLILLILGIFGLFISSVIFYLTYKILDGKGSFGGTVWLVSYTTAVHVFFLIPFVGLIFQIYWIYLTIVGGSFVQKVSNEKFAIAVLIPYILAITYLLHLHPINWRNRGQIKNPKVV